MRVSGSLVRGEDVEALKAAATSDPDQDAITLVLDLAELTAIDVVGLGVLLALRPLLGPSGRLLLLRAPEWLRAKMGRAHIETLFTFASDDVELRHVMDGVADGPEE